MNKKRITCKLSFSRNFHVNQVVYKDMELKKILFTDDDQDIRDLIYICFNNSEIIVELCESGEETLKTIPLFKPDLIVLDVHLPKMDGISTYEALKKDINYGSIPVVFLTANKEEKEINKLLKLGAVDVIFKPFKPLAIEENLQKIWEQKILRKQEMINKE